MDIKGGIDPRTIGDMWMRSRPRDAGRQNQMEMWSLVGALSDPAHNIHMIVVGGGDNVLYKKTICGSLLACSSDGNPDTVFAGLTSDPRQSRFEFQTIERADSTEGRLVLMPAPMTYTNDDRAMLFGIIQHELRHYMDFLDNNRRPIDTDYMRELPGGNYEIDVDMYARNITEMRAHADQAAQLLRIMGGAENAKKAIRNSQFGMVMIPDMAKAMFVFIDMLDKESSLGEAIDPPAAVVRSEDHDVRALVGHLQRMCEVMKFSNNVRQRR